MAFSKIFGSKENVSEDEFLEVDVDTAESGLEYVPIKIIELKEYTDADEIQKAVREGSIVFTKIKTLKEKDMSELKRAIERIRKTVVAIGGDIAGVDEGYIIVCPKFARIHREEK